MRGMILVAVCLGAIAVAVGEWVAAAAAHVRSVRSGTVTWIGTVGAVPAMQPSPWDAAHRPNARLVVSAAAIDASFEGYTGATHDSGSARTSCSSHYRLVRRVGAWSYYRQVGASRWPGRDYVANSPCILRSGGAMKTTLTGTKLRADFSPWGDPATGWRGYLRRG